MGFHENLKGTAFSVRYIFYVNSLVLVCEPFGKTQGIPKIDVN